MKRTNYICERGERGEKVWGKSVGGRVTFYTKNCYDKTLSKSFYYEFFIESLGGFELL